jgi:hypothetical protein
VRQSSNILNLDYRETVAQTSDNMYLPYGLMFLQTSDGDEALIVQN